MVSLHTICTCGLFFSSTIFGVYFSVHACTRRLIEKYEIVRYAYAIVERTHGNLCMLSIQFKVAKGISTHNVTHPFQICTLAHSHSLSLSLALVLSSFMFSFRLFFSLFFSFSYFTSGKLRAQFTECLFTFCLVCPHRNDRK